MRASVDGIVAVGGHSYGGRQASMLAAEQPGSIDALLLLSYPLHPPKKPQQLRTAHFSAWRTPALFVHGTRDPFASTEELNAAIAEIPASTRIMTVERAGHELKGVDTAAVVAAFHRDRQMRIGIDAGGTFTDFVVLQDDGRIATFKIRSNPQSPASVILEGIRRARMQSDGQADEVVHGSTVATNALLERKGARTALVTTKGFEDLLVIGRQNRPELYNLTPRLPAPLVAPRIAWEPTNVSRTMALYCALFDGRVPAHRTRIAKRRKVQSVAISLLHSYENAVHEKMLAKALESSGLYVSASHEVSPEFREYERTSTTVINSYVGPLMHSYLAEVERGCPHKLFVMQSNGGLLTAGRSQPPCCTHSFIGAGRRHRRRVAPGRARGIRPVDHLRYGRDFDRCQPGGAAFPFEFGYAAGRLSGACADARDPHGGRGRRLDCAHG